MQRKRIGIGIGLALAAVLALAAAVVAIAAGSSGSSSGAAAAPPTWARVAPVFAQKCAGCHTPGGIAPFSLRSAQAAKAHADGILVMTQLGRMPPWMPGHDSPAYIGQSQRILTRAEKQLIARWVRGGASIAGRRPSRPVGGGSSAPGTTMALSPTRPYLPKRAV
ncbi:MAG: c-type cytochrome, partial [Gaiellaceae bacterium]